MKFNRIFLLFISIAFMLVLIACAGDGEPEPVEDETDETTDSGDGEEATDGGEDQHVVIAVPAELSSLSAHGSNDVPSGNVRTNIYDTLIALDLWNVHDIQSHGHSHPGCLHAAASASIAILLFHLQERL